jgi:S1-C subfamily serine protease
VIAGGYRFEVELHDRRRFAAQLIGADGDSDLAVLKIEANNLLAAEWGDSDRLDVGSIVWAFGNPHQLKQTVTSGIISGKDRPGDWETLRDEKQTLLQTDAAINQGNSGGPLVDSRGQVIGINTAILGETFQGIGFAVPSATARYVVDQIREHGTVTRGFLGAKPVEVSNQDAQRFGLPDLHGAKLLSVFANSPAAKAGMRSSDVIRTWDGVEIRDYKTLYRLAEMTPPNSLVQVTLLRQGEEFRTTVRVGDRSQVLGK